MLYKTSGIVINYIKFKETSIITKIYTKDFGIQSYIVNGVRSKKSRNKIALFQPLNLLDLVVYNKKTANINRISEIKCSIPFNSIPYDIRKSGIALFVNEILNKVLKEQVEDPDLFEFIWQSVLLLEGQDKNYQNFHLKFLLKLSQFLGFAPSNGAEIFKQVYNSDESLVKKETALFNQLLKKNFNEYVVIPNSLRRELLEALVKYYRVHIETLGEVKSVKILQEVLQ